MMIVIWNDQGSCDLVWGVEPLTLTQNSIALYSSTWSLWMLLLPFSVSYEMFCLWILKHKMKRPLERNVSGSVEHMLNGVYDSGTCCFHLNTQVCNICSELNKGRSETLAER
jgi:hypothetical protein